MKTKLKIEGLNCPNCARSLEKEINKIDGVKNAKIDFVKSSLVFESENEDVATRKITMLTKKLEPQAILKSEKDKKSKKGLWLDIICLAIGISIGGVLLGVSGLPVALYWSLYVLAALLMGWRTYLRAVRLLFRGTINENLLITISVIGASVPGISEHLEGLMVIMLYSIGKILEGLAVDKSRKSIETLAQMKPEYAVLVDGENETQCLPEEVEVGSLIVVRAGEKIPLDGIVEKGGCNIDMQSLTGESLPVEVKEGSEVLSGSVVLDGALYIRTTSLASESTVGKIMELVDKASENKSKTETFISKITKWYTLAVVVLAVLVWGIVWAVTKNLDDAVYRGLTFLVVSCPCAFAISVPLSYFSGLGNASKHGVLIKGSNHLDTCARLKAVAFDKTGTLTTGEFSVEKITSFDENFDEEKILFLAALGEQNSLHPLAKSIVSACKTPLEKVENVKEFAGSGVEFVFENATYFVGRRAEAAPSEEATDLENAATVVELFKDDRKIGEISLADTIKPNSVATCEGLRKIGVKTVLLSGDNARSVQKVASAVGIDEFHSGLLPQDKYAYLEKQKAEVCTGYVGDGLNDAPSLMLADVGISMGIGGNPASIEASDVVLVDDDPKKILTAIKISKYTRKIVWQNIILSALVKLTFLTLGALGITGMMWAVFADVGVTLLAILNSLRALYFKAK